MRGLGKSSLARVAVLILFGVMVLARPNAVSAQEEMESAGHWMDGVKQIVIVDESRCSSSVHNCDSSRVYVIKGADKIERLRKALDKLNIHHQGICACGGPDIHLFCPLDNGGTRYLGLDCDTFLNGVQITDEVRSLINPSGDNFLGVPIGYPLIAEAPISMPVSQVQAMGRKAGYRIMGVESWRSWNTKWMIRGTAPFAITLQMTKGPVTVPINEQDSIENKWKDEVGAAFQKWIDQEGLASSIRTKGRVDEARGHFYMEEMTWTFEQTFFLENTPQAREEAEMGPRRSGTLEVAKIEKRDEAEQTKPYFYAVYVVISSPPCTAHVVDYAAASLPVLKDMRPVCDERRGVVEKTL